jgi:hypothetical protein
MLGPLGFIKLNPQVLMLLKYYHSYLKTSYFASSKSFVAFIIALPFTIDSSYFKAGTSYLPSSIASVTATVIATEGWMPFEALSAELEVEATNVSSPFLD